MSDGTEISWTDATWNPVTGCTKVSDGCLNCYITRTPPFRMAGRKWDGEGIGATTGVLTHPDRLDQPLRWTKPRRVFVNSLSDLFHDSVNDGFIAHVFAVMALAPEHTFQILTKRHGRLRSLLNRGDFRGLVADELTEIMCRRGRLRHPDVTELERRNPNIWRPKVWPLPNVWVGVSVEDQKAADLRIPALLATPAAVRFLSCEPLIGPVDLEFIHYFEPNCGGCSGILSPAHEPACGTEPGKHWGIDWVIVGGESGSGARPMHPDWARSLRDQCVAAGVAFHFKQWGEWAPHRLEGGSHTNVALSKTRWQYESDRFAPDGARYVASEPDGYSLPGMTTMLRVGKRKAGRELDGRMWDEFPEVVTS